MAITSAARKREELFLPFFPGMTAISPPLAAAAGASSSSSAAKNLDNVWLIFSFPFGRWHTSNNCQIMTRGGRRRRRRTEKKGGREKGRLLWLMRGGGGGGTFARAIFWGRDGWHPAPLLLLLLLTQVDVRAFLSAFLLLLWRASS